MAFWIVLFFAQTGNAVACALLAINAFRGIRQLLGIVEWYQAHWEPIQTKAPAEQAPRQPPDPTGGPLAKGIDPILGTAGRQPSYGALAASQEAEAMGNAPVPYVPTFHLPLDYYQRKGRASDAQEAGAPPDRERAQAGDHEAP